MPSRLATIPRTFFHYTPSAEKTSTNPHAIAIATELTSKKSPKKSPPNEFCRNVGEVGLNGSARKSDIKTAAEFIEKVASVSSTSGKPYLTHFQDCKEVKSGDYLHAKVEKIEAT